MIKRTFLLALFMSLTASGSFAHPPSSLEADYVKGESKLYVYMNHVSRDHRDHYIRKLQVLINGKEAAITTNRQQIDPGHFGDAVALSPEPGDEVEIKAFCSEGGIKSTSILIPEEKEGTDKGEAEAQKPSEVKAKVLAYQSERADSGVYGSKADVYGSKENVVDAQADPHASKADIYGSKTKAVGNSKNVYGSKKSAVKEKGSGY